MRWQLQGVSYIVPKRHELWSTNGFKLDRHFNQPSMNSAVYFIARIQNAEQQTGLNQPLPTGRQYIVLKICHKKVGGCFSQKIGSFYIFDDFET